MIECVLDFWKKLKYFCFLVLLNFIFFLIYDIDCLFRFFFRIVIIVLEFIVIVERFED